MTHFVVLTVSLSSYIACAVQTKLNQKSDILQLKYRFITSCKLFDNYSSTLCERLHSLTAASDFAAYFDRNWVSCKEKWCYY